MKFFLPILTAIPLAVVAKETIALDPEAYFDLYGNPMPVHDFETRLEYISSYDRERRIPKWVIEHMTSESVGKDSAERDESHFREDTAIPEQFRARLEDYYRSGYDRGHHAAAADCSFSQDAMDESFYLTNMAPQVGVGFNRQYWAYFEAFVRNLTEKYDSIRVITGSLFLPTKDDSDGKWRVTYEVIGNPPTVAVPTHFYKIIVGESSDSGQSDDGVAVGAFILPNKYISEDTNLTSFSASVNDIETNSGLMFFPNLTSSDTRELCKEVECKVEAFHFDD